MPPVASGVPAVHLDPAAAWASTVGAAAMPSRYEAAAAIRITARYDDTRAGVNHVAEWEAIVFPLSNDASNVTEVDHDPRDFIDTAIPAAPYVLPEVRIDSPTFWKALAVQVRERLYREGTITIFKNSDLKIYSRVGESAQDFATPCETFADDAADQATAALGDRYEKRLRRMQVAIDKYGDQAESAAADARGDDIDMVTGAVFDMLSGRSRSRDISSSMKTHRAAQRRVDAAAVKVDTKVAEYEALQEEFQDEVADLVTQWDEKAKHVEEVSIGLEKNDITVSDMALVWIPLP